MSTSDISYKHDHDLTGHAEIAFIYHEFAASGLVASQIKGYRNHQPLCKDGLTKIEAYKYAMTITSGHYLVGGTHPSSQHRIVECNFFKTAMQEYRMGANSGGVKSDPRLKEDDVMALSEVGARLAVDVFLTDRFKGYGFIMTGQNFTPSELDEATGEPLDVMMQFMLKKDMSYYPGIEDRPRATVMLESNKLVPLETMNGKIINSDTMNGEMIDGICNDRFSIDFPRKHKLLHVAARLL